VPRHGPEDPSLLDGPGWGSGLTLCAPTFETHDARMADTVSGGGDTPHGEGVSKMSAGRAGGCGAAPDRHRCILLGSPPECDDWPGLRCGMMHSPRTRIWAQRSIPLIALPPDIWGGKKMPLAPRSLDAVMIAWFGQRENDDPRHHVISPGSWWRRPFMSASWTATSSATSSASQRGKLGQQQSLGST